jgi:hypothetical protein
MLLAAPSLRALDLSPPPFMHSESDSPKPADLMIASYDHPDWTSPSRTDAAGLFFQALARKRGQSVGEASSSNAPPSTHAALEHLALAGEGLSEARAKKLGWGHPEGMVKPALLTSLDGFTRLASLELRRLSLSVADDFTVGALPSLRVLRIEHLICTLPSPRYGNSGVVPARLAANATCEHALCRLLQALLRACRGLRALHLLCSTDYATRDPHELQAGSPASAMASRAALRTPDGTFEHLPSTTLEELEIADLALTPECGLELHDYLVLRRLRLRRCGPYAQSVAAGLRAGNPRLACTLLERVPTASATKRAAAGSTLDDGKSKATDVKKARGKAPEKLVPLEGAVHAIKIGGVQAKARCFEHGTAKCDGAGESWVAYCDKDVGCAWLPAAVFARIT